MSTLSVLQDEATLHHLCETSELRAALRAKLAPTARSKVHSGDLVLMDRETLAFDEGDVRIEGNLVLGWQAHVYAAGNLQVTGNVVASSLDYTLLFVGGVLEARNLFFNGELVALEGIRVSSVAWTFYNDHSTDTESLRAQVVVHEDRSEFISATHAAHVVDAQPSKFKDALGPLLRADVVVDEYGAWDHRELSRRLEDGEDLLAG